MAGRIDPRWYQIGVLSGLAAYGSSLLALEVQIAHAAAAVAGALGTHLLANARDPERRRDLKSPLISALSLALLLRAGDPLWLFAAGVLAIASKATLRARGKHLFNPSCFAIVALLASSDSVWVSGGQWGSGPLFALAAAGFGSLVLNRSARSDITWAFLAVWAGLVLGRAAWLGDPWTIPLHGLQSGALLVFAFFMISDPRSTPDSRAGRLAFAAVVAAVAAGLQFGLFWSNPLLWALAGCAPLVPALDRLLPGRRYDWGSAARALPSLPDCLTKENPMKPVLYTSVAVLALLCAPAAHAFCGFYVAKADTKLFNKASQVVIARDGQRTVMTMSNDYRGDPKEFAMVIPVPTFIEREQIHIGDRKVIEHLDAYTAPRLVEYFDADPCQRAREEADGMFSLRRAVPSTAGRMDQKLAKALGVRIEAQYTVGEYEILILSAEQSDGLARWLRESGYRLPDGAEPVLDSYLKQDMRFFVARVDLAKQQKLGFSYLRPLQVAYESPKFMLPIRLGTLNADGAQELFVYTLTRKGRVETTNYRNTRLPTGSEVPVFVKSEFGDFYRSLFDAQVQKEDMRTVFLEYAWDMNWCDPCAADPLSDAELRGLGVFWVGSAANVGPARSVRGPARNVFVTRLHVRYDAEHFPADLVFQETGDRKNFQGRYVIRHPFTGPATCPAAETYRRTVAERQEREAQTLASLTGWDVAEIRKKLGLGTLPVSGPVPWWQQIWAD